MDDVMEKRNQANEVKDHNVDTHHDDNHIDNHLNQSEWDSMEESAEHDWP